MWTAPTVGVFVGVQTYSGLYTSLTLHQVQWESGIDTQQTFISRFSCYWLSKPMVIVHQHTCLSFQLCGRESQSGRVGRNHVDHCGGVGLALGTPYVGELRLCLISGVFCFIFFILGRNICCSLSLCFNKSNELNWSSLPQLAELCTN